LSDVKKYLIEDEMEFERERYGSMAEFVKEKT